MRLFPKCQLPVPMYWCNVNCNILHGKVPTHDFALFEKGKLCCNCIKAVIESNCAIYFVDSSFSMSRHCYIVRMAFAILKGKLGKNKS